MTWKLYSKLLEATDVKCICNFAISVSRLGTHSDIKIEDHAMIVLALLPWNKSGEIRWLLELENLESDSSNLEHLALWLQQDANAICMKEV